MFRQLVDCCRLALSWPRSTFAGGDRLWRQGPHGGGHALGHAGGGHGAAYRGYGGHGAGLSRGRRARRWLMAAAGTAATAGMAIAAGMAATTVTLWSRPWLGCAALRELRDTTRIYYPYPYTTYNYVPVRLPIDSSPFYNTCPGRLLRLRMCRGPHCSP